MVSLEEEVSLVQSLRIAGGGLGESRWESEDGCCWLKRGSYSGLGPCSKSLSIERF